MPLYYYRFRKTSYDAWKFTYDKKIAICCAKAGYYIERNNVSNHCFHWVPFMRKTTLSALEMKCREEF